MSILLKQPYTINEDFDEEEMWPDSGSDATYEYDWNAPEWDRTH